MSKKMSLLISVQLIIIVFLVADLARRAQPSVSVSELSKDALVFPETEELNYFFEFPPNRVDSRTTPWLHTAPEIKMNSDGLNSLHDYPIEKGPGTFRVIILGDSFTYGIYVSTKDNFSSRLESILNQEPTCAGTKFEVLNLGMGGYDLRYAVERFNLRGQKYDPDLIIWAIHPNDFKEINEYIAPKIETYMAEFKNGESDTDYANSPEANYKYHFLASKKVKEEQNQEISQSELFRYQDQALRLIRDTYQGKILLYTWSNVLETPPEAYQIMEVFSKESPYTFYYPSPVMFEKEDHLPDFHPSTSGHEKTAHDIFEYLVQHNLIPCSQE